MMRIAALGLILLMIGCSDDVPSNGVPEGTNADDISRAALDLVYPLPSCDKSYFGGTVQRCDDALARVVERRKEFESFDPPWMRKAVMHWFDHAERNIKEAREDCVTQKSKKEMDDYDKRSKAERERASNILRSIGK